MKTKILFLTTILLSSLTFAQELSTSVEKKVSTAAPKWKATAATYYYNFEGSKASQTDAKYEFGDASLAMELLTLQYAYSSNWTIQVVGQYLDNYAETKMWGLDLKDRTKGMGDTFVSGITPLVVNPSFMLLGDVGLSLPTGRIDFENANNIGTHYAYNMQAGSGTVDAVTGVTALSFHGPVQLGGHLAGIFRNGENANGYRLGNQYRADVWADYNTKSGFTPRLVGYYKHKDAIIGQDDQYEKQRELYAPYYEFYHHSQVNWDLSAAVKYTQNVGPMNVSAEVGVPVAQNSVNYDSAVVSTQYYGNVSLAGSF